MFPLLSCAKFIVFVFLLFSVQRVHDFSHRV